MSGCSRERGSVDCVCVSVCVCVCVIPYENSCCMGSN